MTIIEPRNYGEWGIYFERKDLPNMSQPALFYTHDTLMRHLEEWEETWSLDIRHHMTVKDLLLHVGSKVGETRKKGIAKYRAAVLHLFDETWEYRRQHYKGTFAWCEREKEEEQELEGA